MAVLDRLPVLGALPPVARLIVLATLAVSALGIVLAWVVGADPTLLFVVSGIAILGLAWLIGLSTERLGALSGPQVGGILNATFGNIAELIIAFFALREGLIEVVKASLTGSIIGNLLLVLGASVLVGGLRPRRPLSPAEEILEQDDAAHAERSQPGAQHPAAARSHCRAKALPGADAAPATHRLRPAQLPTRLRTTAS